MFFGLLLMYSQSPTGSRPAQLRA